MESVSALLNSYYAVSSARPLALTSRNFSPYLSLHRISRRNSSAFLASNNKSTGFLLPCETFRLCSSSLAAGVGNTTAVTNESSEGHLSFGKQPDLEAKDEPNNKNNEEQDDTDARCEKLDDSKMLRVCDKLIEVFVVDKPTPADWRRLLTFSKEWDDIRPHFYKRCQDRSESEGDPGMKHKILRLSRKLKEIDEDIQRHNKLLDAIRNSPSEVGEIIAQRRKDFTKEFFVHLHTVAESYYDNPEEQNAVAKLGNTCLAAVQAYDTANESIEALNAAELKFQDIINSPSVDAACRKIDSLAEKNQLDSALVLMITKAWSAAKESNMMKDEVKDILYHLYKTSRGNLQRLMPKEIRILKYLLTIEDPEERMSALNDAFTPGQELEGQDLDCLYT
ncbi:hypothetical protein RD792_011174 [Penstemon davidsonii]|uniref:Uncharacterized protein n=1 Tax=Penstemon davidsonii TaxID=160366 RepID=A0ABR0D3W4_9LAMI|nr:hypothetical protein RD792_011174 [Penstemon davidsonii]